MEDIINDDILLAEEWPPNIAEYTERKFLKLFRVPRDGVLEFVEIIRPFMDIGQTASHSILVRVLCFLQFVAQGCYQTPIGVAEYLSISQPTISRYIEQVVVALNSPEIFGPWVHFPNTMEEIRLMTQGFLNVFNFHGILGCTDCTHIRIFTPPNRPEAPEASFVNRKGFHSLNCQITCDYRMRITHINSSFPGSSQDRYIFLNSNLSRWLQNIYDQGQRGLYLLGDSGYNLRPWMLIPYANPQGAREAAFNQAHIRTRNIVERTIGVLKNRFRCLLVDRTLHYSPEKAARLIKACAVLHNFCIERNYPEPPGEPRAQDPPNNEDDAIFHDLDNDMLQAGRQVRDQVVTTYY